MSLTASCPQWRTRRDVGSAEGALSRTWAIVRECTDFTARCAGYMAFLAGLLLAFHLIANSF